MLQVTKAPSTPCNMLNYNLLSNKYNFKVIFEFLILFTFVLGLHSRSIILSTKHFFQVRWQACTHLPCLRLWIFQLVLRVTWRYEGKEILRNNWKRNENNSLINKGVEASKESYMWYKRERLLISIWDLWRQLLEIREEPVTKWVSWLTFSQSKVLIHQLKLSSVKANAEQSNVSADVFTVARP